MKFGRISSSSSLYYDLYKNDVVKLHGFYDNQKRYFNVSKKSYVKDSPFDPVDDIPFSLEVKATTSAHDNIPKSLHKQEKLKRLFDSNSYWSGKKLDSFLTSDQLTWGICGIRAFDSPSSFLRTADLVETEIKHIVDAICENDDLINNSLIVERLDTISNLLCSVIDACDAFRHIHTNPAFIAAANKCHQQLISFMNILNTTPKLYDILDKAIKTPEIYNKWSGQAKRVAHLLLKDFEKSGIKMEGSDRKLFVTLNDNIGLLGYEFISNQGPGKRYFRIDEPYEALSGIPSHIIKDICGDNTRSVELPTTPLYIRMILEHCDVEKSRQLAYYAKFSTNEKRLDTMNKLMETRYSLAKLLGRRNYVDLVLENNLIKHENDVMKFLDEMNNINKPRLEKVLNKLTKLKQVHTNDENAVIQAWDQSYYENMYQNSSPELKKKLNKLISDSIDVKDINDGLNEEEFNPITLGEAFADLAVIIRTLYGIRFVIDYPVPGECWSDDVRKLVLYDRHNNKLGIIYCDLFARAPDENQKPDGAVHYTVRCSKRIDNEIFFTPDFYSGLLRPPFGEIKENLSNGQTRVYQLPIVILSTNFYKSVKENDSTLLASSEIRTLYHEMGHALHSMLAKTDYQHISGTRVPIDFVEVPSVFMESFATIPPKVPNVDPIEFQTQIFLSVLDQCMHLGIPTDKAYEYHPFKISPELCIEASFGHLASYGGSYYSYLLSRRLVGNIHKTLNLDKLDTSIESLGKWSNAGTSIYNNLLKHGGGRDPWIGLKNLNANA